MSGGAISRQKLLLNTKQALIGRPNKGPNVCPSFGGPEEGRWDGGGGVSGSQYVAATEADGVAIALLVIRAVVEGAPA